MVVKCGNAVLDLCSVFFLSSALFCCLFCGLFLSLVAGSALGSFLASIMSFVSSSVFICCTCGCGVFCSVSGSGVAILKGCLVSFVVCSVFVSSYFSVKNNHLFYCIIKITCLGVSVASVATGSVFFFFCGVLLALPKIQLNKSKKTIKYVKIYWEEQYQAGYHNAKL